MIPSYDTRWEIQVLPGHSFVVLYCKNAKGETVTMEIGHSHIDQLIEEINDARSTFND